MAGRRAQQLADLLQHEIAALIQRGLRDPRIGFVTVTGVRLSPDLRNARVFVSVLGDREAEALAALTGAAGWLRRNLARRTRLKQVPQLTFQVDEALRRGERIEALLAGLRPQAGEE
jgi:ribosome-binding factor A